MTMAGPPWFYHSFDSLESDLLELVGEEANHILGARRMRPGDELVLSNGRGELAHCTLESADKKARSLKLRISLVAELERPAKELVLASALPKGDRLSTMLDMACQLGVTHFQPLQFERSVTRWNKKLRSRCERILIEASKQSKTAYVPSISKPLDYQAYLTGKEIDGQLTLVADQFGYPLKTVVQQITDASTICVLVGPEGGLSEAETSLALDQDIVHVRLAESVLRVETAAIAAISALHTFF